MRYALAFFAAGAIAAPAAGNEWETWTTTTTPAAPTTWGTYTTPAATWAPVPEVKKCTTTTLYTTKECGENKDAWDNCKDVTKTKTVTLDKCPETWAPAPEPTKWAPVPEVKKCSTTSIWTTKECGDKKDAWDNCKDVTKTTVVVLDKCPVTWAPVPEVKKCSTTSVYTTKECGDKKDAWDNCKDVTKTTTVILDKCPAETWAPVPEVPVAPASTWAPASVPAKASSTVWAPVAKYTGAANKESFGIGALAIAAVAAML